MLDVVTPVAPVIQKIKATVAVNKKLPLNYEELDHLLTGPAEEATEFFALNASLRLVSADKTDPTDPMGAKVGIPIYLKDPNFTPLLADSNFTVEFDWTEDFGTPGALLVRNLNSAEFYLKTVTLEDVPGRGRITFICNSWVYNIDKNLTARIFFANKTYAPDQMPKPLRRYREEELRILRGNGQGELQEWDRVYDYAVYNDLGNPDAGPEYKRQTLGGSAEFPYPRRGRTGRPPTKSDPTCESRLPMVKSLSIYVPRDERFNRFKMKDFIADGLKALPQNILPLFEFITGDREFTSFEEVLRLYDGPLSNLVTNEKLQQLLKYPMPHVIQNDKEAWRTDEEFAREMLAGVNPILIRRLEEFPPKSKLDSAVYGNQNSLIRKEHIESNLDGYTVNQALMNNKLFILDHHDPLMPYLRRINTTTTKTYASRTLLFLKDDGTLKPLAIELSYPHPEADIYGCVSKVYTPTKDGVEGSIWELAKAYVAVNDSGYHQLISHWLNTHAVIEPFVIATHRQLSVVHPIHKLLQPHFLDTMYINASARQTLINAGGVLEMTVYPAKYAMEMSAVVYKSWNFLEQALPADLKKRGIAIDDRNSPHGLSLLIKDYPYAVDGLEIWFAIEEWVKNYCSFYYRTDAMVQQDKELQAWWKELREKGHGDLKDEPWWPKMQTLQDLIHSCTIIIWVASALHAAVNFAQYPYAGYLPNRPTISRRFMPQEGSPEYAELKSNPEKVFLSIITSQLMTLIGVSLIEILSRHSADEVYLGDRSDPDLWTTDAKPLKDFNDFGNKLHQIEEKIIQMNSDKTLKNRSGPVDVPFTQLVPSSKPGLTGMGIPNSVSI
ncbi:hypothetical protein DITRI_Ditri06bG0165200 [Diplodiscus trichospermus]